MDAFNPLNILTETELELESAAFDPGLSVAGFDEETKLFFATADRLFGQKLFEIVSTVLKAQGYVVNLENTLAAIESIVVGANSRTKKKNAVTEEIAAWLPGLAFRLPQKGRIGPLLQLFYQEIAPYETELLMLRTAESAKNDGSGGKESIQDLQKKIKDLEFENQVLKRELEDQSVRMVSLRQSHDDYSRVVAEGQALPPGLRIGVVKGVNLAKRQIVCRVGKGSFSFPMAKIWVIPHSDEPCIVRSNGGKITDVWPIPTQKSGRMEIRVCRVLMREESKLKLRDHRRKIWVTELQNADEMEICKGLMRGDQALIWVVDDRLAKIVPMKKDLGEHLVNRVREAMISQNLMTQIAYAVVEKHSKITDEVA